MHQNNMYLCKVQRQCTEITYIYVKYKDNAPKTTCIYVKYKDTALK